MVCSSWNLVSFKAVKDLENNDFALEVQSNHRQQKARKVYSREENLYVRFVDLKNYINGILTH